MSGVRIGPPSMSGTDDGRCTGKEELEKYRKETADVEKETNDASFKANEKLVQLKALGEEIQKSVKSFDSSIQEEEIEKSLALIGQQMDASKSQKRKLQKKAGSS